MGTRASKIHYLCVQQFNLIKFDLNSLYTFHLNSAFKLMSQMNEIQSNKLSEIKTIHRNCKHPFDRIDL